MSKRVGALALPSCKDPTSTQYRQHRWVQWGDDPRFSRCSRCEAISAEDISNEAKYPRVRQADRPMKHHHQFAVSLLDPRYEVCRCGKVIRAQKLLMVEKTELRQTCVVHVHRDDFDIYIGRRMPRFPKLVVSGWGNPFTVRDLPRGYDNPVYAFRDWLLGKPELAALYRNQRAMMLGQLFMLRGKVLGCWCAPKGGLPGNLDGTVCHGEVLAWLADHPEDVPDSVRVGGAA